MASVTPSRSGGLGRTTRCEACMRRVIRALPEGAAAIAPSPAAVTNRRTGLGFP